jgi:N-methylhydantoinase A
MRYLGQGHEILVTLPMHSLKARDAGTLRQAFERRYGQLFGRIIPDADIEILTWSLALTTRAAVLPKDGLARARRRATPSGHCLVAEARRRPARWPVYWRSDLKSGARLTGPALIAEYDTTTVVPADFAAAVTRRGHLLIERRKPRRGVAR